MPAAVAAIVAFVTSTQFLVSLAVSLAISAITAALTPKPKLPSFADSLNNRTLNIREPIAPRQIIYGQIRVGGVFTLLETSGVKNEFLDIVLSIAGHEVEEIGDIYFDDELIPLDGNGDATGKFSGLVTVKKGLGTTAGDADFNTALQVNQPTKWSPFHKQEGVAKIYARLKLNRELFPGLPNITAIVKGKKIFDPRDSVTRWSPNSALIIRDYLTDSLLGFGESTSNINDTDWQAEANICEESVALLSQTDTFTVDDTTDEITLDTSPVDISALAVGNGVQFTTTGTLPAPLATSTTYYWIPIRAGVGKVATTVQNAIQGVAVNITTTGTGTHTLDRQSELRYLSDGMVTTDAEHKDIIADMLSACGGRLSYQSGAWNLYTAAFRTPVHTFTDADFLEPLDVQTRVSKRELINGVRGVFANPDNLYQPDDFPAVTNSTFLAEDLSDELWLDIDLNHTTSSIAAQRLAKIELERSRQQINVSAVIHLKGLVVKTGDTVNITYDRFGWSSKDFEIVDWRLETKDDGGVQIPTIRMELRETASALFDWNLGEETKVDPAPDSGLPDPNTALPPVNLVLTSSAAELFVSGDGTITSRILAMWDLPDDAFVDGFEVQFKKNSATEWDSTTVAFDQTQIFIGPVQDGTSWDVRVRSVNMTGAKSEWVQELGHTVVGKTDPPAPPDTFTVTVDADGTRRYQWTHVSPDPDVKSGGGYHIRYFLGSTSNWNLMTPLHEGILVSSPYESNDLAAGTYTFAIKSVDSSNPRNESTNAVFINNVALGNPRIANAILQRNEKTQGWDGTKTLCFVNVENEIEATGSDDWADLPASWSLLDDEWRGIVANNSPITYTTPTIDLGQDFSIKPIVSLQATGTVGLKMKTGTDSDGAPVGSFVDFDLVVARYLQIEVKVTGTTPGIHAMITVIDAPATIEIFDDLNTGTSTDPAFESIAAGHFKTQTLGGISRITQASITAIQNAGPGFSWELLDKDAGFGNNLVSNGDFPTNLTGWTDADTGTGVSSWVSAVMRLNGGATGDAIRHQTIASLTIGQRYQVRFDVVGNAANLTIDGDTFGDGAHLPITNYAVGNGHIVNFEAVETSATLVFSNDQNNNADIDNVVFTDGTPTAEFKVYNTSDVLTDATVDVQLRGARV